MSQKTEAQSRQRFFANYAKRLADGTTHGEAHFRETSPALLRLPFFCPDEMKIGSYLFSF
jgi:hypothetical protein